MKKMYKLLIASILFLLILTIGQSTYAATEITPKGGAQNNFYTTITEGTNTYKLLDIDTNGIFSNGNTAYYITVKGNKERELVITFEDSKFHLENMNGPITERKDENGGKTKIYKVEPEKRLFLWIDALGSGLKRKESYNITIENREYNSNNWVDNKGISQSNPYPINVVNNAGTASSLTANNFKNNGSKNTFYFTINKEATYSADAVIGGKTIKDILTSDQYCGVATTGNTDDTNIRPSKETGNDDWDYNQIKLQTGTVYYISFFNNYIPTSITFTFLTEQGEEVTPEEVQDAHWGTDESVTQYTLSVVGGDQGTDLENPLENPDAYTVGGVEDDAEINSKVNQILNVISIIGVVVGVIILVIIGIKYVLGSAEQKAEYKDRIIAYVLGAILIASGPAIVNMLYQFAQSLE